MMSKGKNVEADHFRQNSDKLELQFAFCYFISFYFCSNLQKRFKIRYCKLVISELSNHQTRNHFSIHRIAELPKYGHSTSAIDSVISCIVETENDSLSTKIFCNEIG